MVTVIKILGGLGGGGWACVIDEGSSDAQGELQHL